MRRISLFLPADTPLFSKELRRPLRLASLAVGIALLIAGSIWLPSDDWDVPICFIMGIPSYVLAPWVFRQVYYFRWRWLVPAAVALWFTIDGSYSAYWWLRGFDALLVFRPANYFYCIWIFWICGILWNLDYANARSGMPVSKSDEVGEYQLLQTKFCLQAVASLLLDWVLSILIAAALGFCRIAGDYPRLALEWNF